MYGREIVSLVLSRKDGSRIECFGGIGFFSALYDPAISGSCGQSCESCGSKSGNISQLASGYIGYFARSCYFSLEAGKASAGAETGFLYHLECHLFVDMGGSFFRGIYYLIFRLKN